MLGLRFAVVIAGNESGAKLASRFPSTMDLMPRVCWTSVDTDEVAGWQCGLLPNASTVSLVRKGMQQLPLVDGFLLAADDGQHCEALDAGVMDAMVQRYTEVRLKLGRIVALRRDGTICWPWLVDIGFRQPFVELADDAGFTAVIEANSSQVHFIDLPLRAKLQAK